MRVVDYDPHDWFLFECEDGLLLDVNCDHSAVGYSVLIPLNGDETAQFAALGKAYLNDLAQAIHYAGPGSSLQSRSVLKEYGERCREAVKEWRAAQ